MKQPTTMQMTTNFDGLIRLLADGLYNTSDIFVRELVQNCRDGIVLRQVQTHNPFYPGAIDIAYDPVASTISFADNGVGMDESDIRQFLICPEPCQQRSTYRSENLHKSSLATIDY